MDLPSSTADWKDGKKYIEEEVAHSALEGPFDSPPFSPWCVTSPLMTREKADSEDRQIIVDLSFPEGGINKYIFPHIFNGKEAIHNLPTVESAVAAIANICMCPDEINMAVVDLSRAYHQFPVSPLDWPLLGIKVGNCQYFYRRLPFSVRMSSFTMQIVVDFLTRALKCRGICAYMYLDDIVIIGPTRAITARHYEQTLHLLDLMGLQVAIKKLQPPSPCVKWLWIDKYFNVEKNLISIPQAELHEIQRCIAAGAKSQSIIKMQLQRIIRLANHLAKVFIGCILATLRAAEGNSITISRHVKADLMWFAKYLSAANGRAILPHNRVVLRIWANAYMDGAGVSDGTRFYTYHFQSNWRPLTV